MLQSTRRASLMVRAAHRLQNRCSLRHPSRKRPGKGTFTKTAGQLHVVQSGSSATVEGNINGDGKADLQLVLQSAVETLRASDFVL